MKIKLFSTLAIAMAFLLSSFTGSDEKSSYTADKEKSKVAWLGKKVTGEHNGHININEAVLDVEGNKLVGGSFSIDMSSITCEDLTDEEYNQKLVGHLKSDDFFGAEKYPTSKFVITSVEHKGGDKYLVTGDITIKETTEEIEFPATVSIKGNQVEAKAKVVIDRSEFDVRYGSSSFFDGLGDKMIYDDFELDIYLVASK